MADKLTNTQRDVDGAIFDITDQQRVFVHNYGNAVADLARNLTFEMMVATAAGLAMGGLVGALVGYRRG